MFSYGTDRGRRLAPHDPSKDYSDELQSTKTSTNFRPAQDCGRGGQPKEPLNDIPRHGGRGGQTLAQLQAGVAEIAGYHDDPVRICEALNCGIMNVIKLEQDNI